MKFVPAMLERARAKGIPNFHIFGEVADDTGQPGKLAKHAPGQAAERARFCVRRDRDQDRHGRVGTESWRGEFFAQDILYDGGDAAALQLPTFLGNHDAGRFSTFIRKAVPNASDEEMLKRVALGHVLMMTARGVPTIYYGDEQGFVGDGNDQDAREDMFTSRAAVYNDNDLFASSATTAQSNLEPITRSTG